MLDLVSNSLVKDSGDIEVAGRNPVGIKQDVEQDLHVRDKMRQTINSLARLCPRVDICAALPVNLQLEPEPPLVGL